MAMEFKNKSTVKSVGATRNRYRGGSVKDKKARPAPTRAKRAAAKQSAKGPRVDRQKLVERVRGLWRSAKLVFGGVVLLSILGVLSIGLVLGYHYLTNHPYFLVKTVTLSGLHRVTRAEVLAAAELDRPVNILTIHLDRIAGRLRRLPWVKDVTVTRRFPDAVVIDVVERRPSILISLDHLYYLDETGRPFKKVDADEQPELPIITGFTWDDFQEKRKEYTKKDLAEVFALLNALVGRNDRFRLENISEVNFDPARGLSLFTREDNVQLKIGFGRYRAKMKRLGRVLAHLKITGQSDGLVYFNLESSPRVIVRRASG
jgi:cell division protein FtsQ